MVALVAAESAEHYKDAAELFRLYGGIPGIEACLDTLDAETDALPGEYAPPGGVILLAYDEGRAVGMVGLKRLDDDACEMKRLFVREGARGTRAGRRLVEAALEEAIRMGYRTMRLETLPDKMAAALALYRSLGFGPIEPYGEAPPSGAVHLEINLP